VTGLADERLIIGRAAFDERGADRTRLLQSGQIVSNVHLCQQARKWLLIKATTGELAGVRA
jgi:hypothetical protein